MKAYNIASWTRYLRNKQKWTLQDLSKKSGLSVSYLSDIEHERAAPTVETLDKIAEAYGMSLAVFFGNVDLELTASERKLIDLFRDGDLRGLLLLLVNEFQHVETA